MTKVVHINTAPGGGAGIAARRLQGAQQAAGMQAAFISKSLSLDFAGTQFNDPFMAYSRPGVLQRLKRKLTRVINPSQADKFRMQFEGLDKGMQYEICSLPFSKFRLEQHPLVQEADLVHLHWVGGILDYPSFFEGINKPVVWTLHDRNPYSGMFHYALDEEQNPQAAQLDEQIRQIKKEGMTAMMAAAITAPSHWITKEAQQSGMFSNEVIYECVPNSIQTDLYAEADPALARKKLGIGPEELVLLFTAGQLNIYRKGLDLLKAALEKISIPIRLLTLGQGYLDIKNNKVKTLPLGFRSREQELAACYAAADGFVLPSREDNLPNTMLEALATGTPVISFAVGGMNEHLKNGSNGLLSASLTSDALRASLEQFASQKPNFDRSKIKQYAKDHFLPEQQVAAYRSIYDKLMQ